MSDFEQCPHEAIRATCPAPCGCRCESCQAITERITELSMTDDRAEMQTNRSFGLKARHETRVERAIRRQVAEEIAQAIEGTRHAGCVLTHLCSTCIVLDRLAGAAREIGNRETS